MNLCPLELGKVFGPGSVDAWSGLWGQDKSIMPQAWPCVHQFNYSSSAGFSSCIYTTELFEL